MKSFCKILKRTLNLEVKSISLRMIKYLKICRRKWLIFRLMRNEFKKKRRLGIPLVIARSSREFARLIRVNNLNKKLESREPKKKYSKEHSMEMRKLSRVSLK